MSDAAKKVSEVLQGVAELIEQLEAIAIEVASKYDAIRALPIEGESEWRRQEKK